ncbi:hypothetical protein DRW03_00570 [Corallococcus sp. H22C18031201]|uniref:hypothetical protein n=1 Tax=Citreicoccus inhibens TaxID=2849499 RepID=UPI000E71DFEE|nr:hypothetical protein [Citreicoccus inhibens]MBU8900557.1 hypothetical protein [Citreicoccus inhibens]RJS27536.1 hypothetical protein DRW03_00570 [Corallococcus sp. H22C18031201]
MPRSYSFDHFQVPKTLPQSRSERRQDKAHLSGSRTRPEHEGEGIHYGRSHAETEELFQEHQLDARRAGASRQRKAPVVPGRRPTAPIGALPATREAAPPTRFPELAEEAGRNLRSLRSSLSDAVRAAGRLVTLPLTGLRLAARRLRPA